MDAPTNSGVSSVTAGWFPVLTLVLGFALSFVTDWFRRQHELERDRESRRETRRDKLSEQRRNFQRETLLALQEAVFDLTRTTGAAHHQDEMAYRKTGQWQKQLLGEELNQQDFLAMRRTGMFVVRVRDSSLRELVLKFRELAGEMASTRLSREACASVMNNMVDLVEQIHNRTGELLRTLDDEEANLS
jgi:hypothetical protein